MKMKRYIIVMLLVLCQTGVALGAKPRGGVTIHDPRIGKEGGNVVVTFRADVSEKTAKRNYSFVFAPMLTDGNFTWSLPAIIVQGRGTRILEDRHIMASGRDVTFHGAIYVRNGEKVDYSAVIPYQLWMDGARLTMEAVYLGCCSSSEMAQEVMTENIVLSPPKTVAVREMPESEPVARELSTAEKLQQSYGFIMPQSSFETLAPGELFDDDRENALTVYFPQGSSRLDRGFGNNSQSMVDLMSSIRIIQNSIDSKVSTVVVAGFASPEGSFDSNDRLAWDRAVSVKQYIMDHSGLPTETIHVYNGSEDWRGLRMLVEKSDFWWRDEVLAIIDNVPIWDSARQVGRQGELMRLHGGEPYRYIFKHYFPLLRNAAYIKVYFDNK